MKKLFAFISVLAVAMAGLFADVSAKKNADGTVDVTFFYGNPRATEVLLAGDFTSWQDGALPMTKGEKGFSLTRTFKMGEEARYKFISDGNWTTDLKAPDFVDDGFGGKNSHIVVADLVASDGDDSGAAKAKINFVSWSMIGVQAKFNTQNNLDKSSKGFDLDNATIGFKSYDKFTGMFLPNAPFYIEIALAEKEMDDYDGNTAGKLNYLYRSDDYGNDLVSWEDGFKNLVSGLVARPVDYLSRTDDNTSASAGPGSNPFLGHLKFGWNTPYINFLTGFNYAKPDVRQAITWTTVCSSWDAGYWHVGGFNQFTLGSKAQAFLEEKTGMTFDIGFAPNKTADRKGTKYGYWGWADVKKDDLVIDFQTNGMYDGEYIFSDPVEHDFILGAKDVFEVGDGRLNFAVQGLVATHQKSSKEILADNPSSTNTTDYFGYSTDVWYRTGDFDGIKNLAGNVQVGYKADTFSVNAEYRFRGAQASMLYLRENHDDGTFDLSSALGVLNSQAVSLDASKTLMDGGIGLNLGVTAEMPLEQIKPDNEFAVAYLTATEGRQSWYASRFGGDNDPLYEIESGAEFTFKPEVTFDLDELAYVPVKLGVYGDMNYNAYSYYEDIKYDDDHIRYDDNEDENKYGCSDSQFRLKKAGLYANIKPDSDILKGVNVYYGFDLSNKTRWFNTLIGQVMFPGDVTANVAVGIKTENMLSDNSFDSDTNNPFAFAVGVSKQFKALKKPVVYAQFVYNMDPFKHFGDGQDNLNLDRANVKGSVEKEGAGDIDAVDWYDGKAAVRVGIRWDI